MGKLQKTNAMRLLDAAEIPYEIREYRVDENDLSGRHIADEVGLPYGQVFKTLVARGDKTGPLVFCIPVDREIDLKAAAALTGNKKIEMLHVRELLALTGYIRGGCSPVGMKKKFPTFFDETARNYARIAISAGARGMQLLVPTDNFLTYIDAPAALLTQKNG